MTLRLVLAHYVYLLALIGGTVNAFADARNGMIRCPGVRMGKRSTVRAILILAVSSFFNPTLFQVMCFSCLHSLDTKLGEMSRNNMRLVHRHLYMDEPMLICGWYATWARSFCY